MQEGLQNPSAPPGNSASSLTSSATSTPKTREREITPLYVKKLLCEAVGTGWVPQTVILSTRAGILRGAYSTPDS